MLAVFYLNICAMFFPVINLLKNKIGTVKLTKTFLLGFL